MKNPFRKITDPDLDRLLEKCVEFTTSEEFLSLTEQQKASVVFFAIPLSLEITGMLNIMDSFKRKEQIDNLETIWKGGKSK